MTTDFRAICVRFADAVDLLCGSGESPGRPGERLILTTHVNGLEELAAEARAALAANPDPAPAAEGGLHGKYLIRRARDGREIDWPAFVLRMDGKDPAAIAAIRAYALHPSCPSDLARDLEFVAGSSPKSRPLPTNSELIGLARSRSPWGEWMRSGGPLASAHLELAELLRDAIARYGTPAPVPVARQKPRWVTCPFCGDDAGHQPPCDPKAYRSAPIAVAKALPRAIDCDDDNQCWWWNDDASQWEWSWLLDDEDDDGNRTYWLPWWALPLPATPQPEQP